MSLFISKLGSLVVSTGQFQTVRSISLASVALQKKQYTSPKRTELPFTSQKVTIESCGELYDSWRKEKRFRILNKGNLKFDVDYIDTAAGTNNAKSDLTVLMLHGSPGKFNDFAEHINFLHGHGVRVIAPNFTEFTHHHPSLFKQTALEKYHFVKDFLTAVDIQKIDMLVAHSSATYPSLHLYLEDNKYDIGALAFLNPGGHKRIKALYPKLAYDLVFKSMANYKWGYFVVKNLFGVIMAVLRPPLRPESFDKVGLAGMAQYYSGYEQADKQFLEFAQCRPPTLIAYSDNDVLMNKYITDELVHQLLGADPSDVWVYDEKGNLVQNGNDTNWLKVMRFVKGSHYCFWKYPDLINQGLLDLLTRSSRQSLVAKQCN